MAKPVRLRPSASAPTVYWALLPLMIAPIPFTLAHIAGNMPSLIGWGPPDGAGGRRSIHGIQAADPNYSKPLVARLRKVLAAKVEAKVRFATVWWGDVVRRRQQTYMQNAKASLRTIDSTARRFIIEGLGDAAAFQKLNIVGTRPITGSTSGLH